MSNLVLYTNPQSRGHVAHWMLEEIGEAYETIWLNYGPEMKDENFLTVNSMGKVPALKHGVVVVTEAAAICAYLGDFFQEKGLIPPHGHPARADFYRWLFFAAGPLEMATTAQALSWKVPDNKGGMVGFGSYDLTLSAIEKALAKGPYICGEQFTAADVYVGASLYFGINFGVIHKNPIFETYVDLITSRPAFQRVRKMNEEYMQNKL